MSVVIASYNHAAYLTECITSALEQTTAPRQVIVVDDGSADGSREIIEAFGNSILPVFQKNQGTYAALNTGFALAKGDWIAIHNSDDAWHPEKLGRQMELAERSAQIGLIHTGWVCIDSESRPYDTLPPGASLPDFHGPPLSDMLTLMLRSMPVVISSAMLSRDAWQRVGPFDPRYLGMGDWDLCLKISREFLFGFVDEPLTRVRKHASNSSTDSTRIAADWSRRDWKYLGHETMMSAADYLRVRARRGEIDRAEAAFALACLGTIHARRSPPAIARRALALSLSLQPLRPQTYARYLSTFLPLKLRRKLS